MKTIGRAIIGVAVLGGLVAGCVSHPGPKSRSQIVQMAPSGTGKSLTAAV